MAREVRSFCRICMGVCGTRLTIENNRILSIRGDRDQMLSRGYACFKGLQAEEAHHGAARLLHPLKRQPDGSFEQIALEQALDEITAKMGAILDRDGVEAIANYIGNGGSFNRTAHDMSDSFVKALGSSQFYSSMTIDQSAKLVSFERMGGWSAGTQDIEGADVYLVFGCNPLVSHSTLNFLCSDPTKRLKEAKAAGMKLIVIDPRLNETARHADLFLQPIPGQDTAIAAGLIRIVLDEGWHDKEFCDAHIWPESITALRQAVDMFTPEYVERRAGLKPGDLRAVAEMFARDGNRGAVVTGTGPNMAAHSNVMQHMADSLTMICGRVRRAGDPSLVDMTSPESPVYAEVIPASRSWGENMSRIRGVRMLGGERLTGTLAEEILTPGKHQIKALMMVGGNLAVVYPDQQRMVEALRALELFVAIEPYMTASARLAHYILPPKLQYERADLPIAAAGFALLTKNWSQYTDAVLDPPDGSEVADDWYIYWAIAKRLGLTIDYAGMGAIDMETPPTTEALLELRMRNARVTVDELKRYPSGNIFRFPSDHVQPARPGSEARINLLPLDVADELHAFADTVKAHAPAAPPSRFTHLLICRRMRDMYNSFGTHNPQVRARVPHNPAFLHPDDMHALGLAEGQPIIIHSEAGRVRATASGDDSIRPGVISLSHGWGGLPEDDEANENGGTCVNKLVDCTRHVEAVNAMPRMSAIPVRIEALTDTSPEPANAFATTANPPRSPASPPCGNS
ncbi:molybdopterin-containing oxidoreductase family protein [Rhizorhabdus argentea]|uniref:molybdopterin-containing oxidoreductase family protein n=1 Tax=Rhizorhabdus argentea TaxID=1387174 RepID=UPI0030EC54AC